MLIQVHDELVLEGPVDEIPEAAGLVQHVMETAYPLKVPLLTESRSGTDWGNLNPLKA